MYDSLRLKLMDSKAILGRELERGANLITHEYQGSRGPY